MKLKILMLSEYFLPFDRGGSEWSTYYLANSLIKENCQVAIFTPNYGTKPYEQIGHLVIYRFPFLKKLKYQSELISPIYHSNILWFFSTTIFLLYRTIKYKPTHLHVQGKYLLPAAVIVGKILHLAVITTIRDYIILCPFAYCINQKNHFHACNFRDIFQKDLKLFIENYKKRKVGFTFFIYLATFRGFIISKILRFFLNKCQHIVAISDKVAQIYRLNFIRVNKTIYNSIIFTKKTKLSTKSENIILFAGRLTKGKGVDLLISAYSKLDSVKSKPKLILIGEGPLKNEIDRQKINKIILLNHQNYQRVINCIKQARLVVIPSRWEEPFGRTALEALSEGVPVLTTNRGGLPEIVDDGITGVIVKPTVQDLFQGLQISLKNEKKFRENIIKLLPKLQNKFELEPTQKYLAIYQNLVEDRIN